MASVYFTSDLHLGHKGILSFGQRQHESLEEMHLSLVDAWNTVVKKKKDIVYILGDVCMDVQEMRWLDRLTGQKRLVLGNHDTFQYPVYAKYFEKVYHFHKSYKGIVLTHIPIHPNELTYRNWKWNVHGHIHNKELSNLGPKYLNINVDVVGYQPLHLDEVRERLS